MYRFVYFFILSSYYLYYECFIPVIFMIYRYCSLYTFLFGRWQDAWYRFFVCLVSPCLDGPLNPQMMLMPAEKLLPYQTAFLLPGHSATFSCSAECNPPCRYAWLFNGNPVSNVTTFSIQSVSEADVGVLACAPYNTKTYNRTYVMITVEMAGE